MQSSLIFQNKKLFLKTKTKKLGLDVGIPPTVRGI